MKHFSNISEVEAHPGYLPDNPVSLANYRGLVGPYQLDFARERLACCVQGDTGQLCKQAHGRGWVVNLANESVSIIGGDCARSKFGTDSSVFKDIRRATNTINRQKIEARLETLLADRAERLAECTALLAQVLELRTKLEEFRTRYGGAVVTALENMARTGNPAVAVEGLTAALRDKDGEITQDERRVPIPIGRIMGIRVLSPHAVPSTAEAVRRLRRLYEGASFDTVRSSKGRRELRAALADHPRVMDEARSLLADGKAFQQGDRTPLCFLVADSVARRRIAHLVHGGSAAKSDKWLAQLDDGLRHKYGVRRIVIRR